MPYLTCEDLQVDMVLASDVQDRTGRVLLRAGCQITEKHLQLFKTWGIAGIEVESGEEQPDTDPLSVLSEEELAVIQSQVDLLYSQIKESPSIMSDLKSLTLLLLAQRKGGPS